MGTYEVDVSKSITADGDGESGDDVSGTRATGEVTSGDVDTYVYEGQIEQLTTESDVRVKINDSTVDSESVLLFYEHGPEKHLVMEAPDVLSSYSFTVDGVVSAGDDAEVGGNDSITDNGDGTVTVNGAAGQGFPDDYHFRGEIADFGAENQDSWTFSLDGQEMSVADLLAYESPTANDPPMPDIAVSSTDALTANLSGKGSSDPDGSIESYEWSVGGSTYTGPLLSHTFDSGGTYTVELTVTDDDGASASTTRDVSVTEPNQPPEADISVTSTDGLTATFDGSGSSDPDGTIESYEWSVNGLDGSTKTGPAVTYTFTSAGTYTVELTVTDGDGESASTTREVSVSEPNQPPTANIGVASTDGLTATFDGSGSSDPDGTIESYEWTFPDGTTKSGPSVAYTFDSAGTYTVELTVTDDAGATASAESDLTVGETNEPPVAAFTSSTGQSVTVTLDAGQSSDPDGEISEYRWNVGGAEYTGQRVSVTFAEPQSVPVELTVVDADGATAGVSGTIDVSEETVTRLGASVS